jgi:hypothetical protein
MSDHARDDLPLPDYDHITTGELPGRIHGLDATGVEQLLAFEREHGDRLPIVQVLEHRLEQLRDGAEPSGPVTEDSPTMNLGAAGGSKVSPATSSPTMNPPSHGVPTNPAQPRPEGPPRS